MNSRFFIVLLFFFNSFCFSEYYSQIGQDKYVNTHFFKNKKNGVFVDIGAHNGITFSNSYFFEKELGWTGLCVEPIPEIFEELENNRVCHCIRGCVTDFTGEGDFLRIKSPVGNYEMLSGLIHKYHPKHLIRIKNEIEKNNGSCELIKVDCFKINDLLDEYNICHIDFLSVDTEGGEYEIISSLDFEKYRVDVISIEDNYNDAKISVFLKNKGYVGKRFKFDMIFFKEDVFE